MNAGAAFTAKIKAQRAYDRKAEVVQGQLDEQQAARLDDERQAQHDEELRQSALAAAKASADSDGRRDAQRKVFRDALAARHREERRAHDALVRRRAAQHAALVASLNAQNRGDQRATLALDATQAEKGRARIAELHVRHRSVDALAGRKADAAATSAAEGATTTAAERRQEDRTAQLQAERSVAQSRTAQNDVMRAAAADAARREAATAGRRETLLAEQQRVLVAERVRSDQLAALATAQRLRRAAEQQLAIAATDRRATLAAEKRDAARADAAKAARIDSLRTAAVARNVAAVKTGALSGALAWITTSPASLVGPTGAPIWLRGVTVAGATEALRSVDPAGALELGSSGLDVLTNLWGANLVRLPLRVEAINDAGLAALDGLIASFAASGAYTLLALDAAGIQVLPDAALASLWQRIAARYADEPAILIEPLAPASPVATNWPGAAWSLLAPIVQVRPATLFVVNARDGAHDLHDFPLRLEDGNVAPGIAYGVRLTSRDAAWLAADGHAFAATYPLFVTAWTDGQTGGEAAWEGIARGLQRDMLSMTAEAWNGPARLVERETFRETRFGLAVRRAMALPQRLPMTPFPYA